MPSQNMQSQTQILELICSHLEKIKPEAGGIGPDTDLIQELGLESLQVMDLVMELEDEFDLSVPLNRLADVHTPAQLAQCISALLEPIDGAV